MLIGITASQGQGKTTLINEYCKRYDAKSADIQSSRNLLKIYDMSLNEVNKDHLIKRVFQDDLLMMHYNSLLKLKNESEDTIIFVERTFIDIFIYALISLGPLNDYSDWINSYYEKCKEYQSELFERVIHLSGRENESIEDDGVRSTNYHFSRMVDSLINLYFDEFSPPYTKIDIHVSSLNGRIWILKNSLNKYIKGNNNEWD